MKCEICKTIERLGLDDSAHDLWYCTDATVARIALRRSRGHLQHVRRQIRLFARAYRIWIWSHQHMVTLGL